MLVVEDELFSRLHAIDLIEGAGSTPRVKAANADEAIAILEARKDIRIVFTDIDMPGSMDGLKLSHAIRKRWPPIELILTSGHFDISDDELPERGRFVQSHIVMKTLLRRYATLLLRRSDNSSTTRPKLACLS